MQSKPRPSGVQVHLNICQLGMYLVTTPVTSISEDEAEGKFCLHWTPYLSTVTLTYILTSWYLSEMPRFRVTRCSHWPHLSALTQTFILTSWYSQCPEMPRFRAKGCLQSRLYLSTQMQTFILTSCYFVDVWKCPGSG